MERVPDFLSLLTPDDRATLEAAARRREFPRGSVILHRGDDSTSVLILLDGRVKIAAYAEVRDAVLAFRGPGDLVGELSAIDGERRSADVAALEPVTALALAGGDFQRLIAERPGIGMALLRVVTGRLRQADGDLATLGAHGVLGRVARRLIELCERYGADCDAGVSITLPLTQEELAGWTGASREAVSKALNTLRGLDWVETHRRELVVTDLDALRTYAGVATGS